MAFCTHCGFRPRPKDNSRLLCVPCVEDLEREERAAERRRKTSTNNMAQYWKILKWKGHYAGIIRTEHRPMPECPAYVEHKVKVHYLGYELKRVASGKLIDLDAWCAGYDAGQVKAMKAMIRNLAPEFRRVTKKRLVAA